MLDSITSSKTMRAAAVQFAVGTSVDENLATCLRMIDRAAGVGPHVIVLPEFCNHIAWWRDQQHCYDTAVSLDGDFLAAIAQRAKRHGCYIKINCTVRRDTPAVTGTNLLFNPAGNLIGEGDKQVLMGNENNFLERALACTAVNRTSFATFGMYCCMDGVVPEVARSLALRGATVLLNSLNSFAFDEASLHIPVRAAENRVFVVAANKVGALVPPDMIEAVAARIRIAPRYLHGAGESQIVDPDGHVLARAPREGEHVIWADIEPQRAGNKLDEHGNDIFALRRPALYRGLAEPPKDRARTATVERATVAALSGQGQQITDGIRDAVQAGARLIVLPELTGDIDALQVALHASDAVIATSRRNGPKQHQAVLVSAQGVEFCQPQLHCSTRLSWHTQVGDNLATFDLGWARIALVTGDDAIHPEVFRLAALAECEVVAVPSAECVAWMRKFGYAERAAENRLGVVVAALDPRDAGIFAADPDFTLWTEWKTRPFDGNISHPRITRANAAGVTLGEVYPAAANNRMVSQKTNVIESRPWNLIDAIVS